MVQKGGGGDGGGSRRTVAGYDDPLACPAGGGGGRTRVPGLAHVDDAEEGRAGVSALRMAGLEVGGGVCSRMTMGAERL